MADAAVLAGHPTGRRCAGDRTAEHRVQVGSRACDREGRRLSDERATAGPAELTWDTARRRARLRFTETGVGGGADARELIAALDRWTERATDGVSAPYTFLVDCSQIVDADAGWRSAWGGYFRQHRDEAVIAWFNANARVRLIVLMFCKGTGVRGRAFETEDAAVAWLDAETGAAA